MATKTKLVQAVEKQAEKLNDAQKELVKAQLSTYKRNSDRLAQIESQLRSMDVGTAASRDEAGYRQSQRASLAYEHSQLLTANSKIAADLFDFLEE